MVSSFTESALRNNDNECTRYKNKSQDKNLELQTRESSLGEKKKKKKKLIIYQKKFIKQDQFKNQNKNSQKNCHSCKHIK